MPKNFFETLFGDTPESKATQAASDARSMAYKDMLNTYKANLEKQSTDAKRMATFNALGNVLGKVVEPLSWKAAGAVAPSSPATDDRQYLESFQRAVKANDDLRNLANTEAEYKFKLADEEYQATKAAAAAEQQRRQALEDYATKSAIDTANKISIYNSKYDREEDLARLKGQYKVTRGGLSVEDRILINQSREYEKYRRMMMSQGEPYISFEQWLRNDGFTVTDKASGSNSGSGSGSAREQGIRRNH